MQKVKFLIYSEHQKMDIKIALSWSIIANRRKALMCKWEKLSIA